MMVGRFEEAVYTLRDITFAAGTRSTSSTQIYGHFGGQLGNYIETLDWSDLIVIA